MNSAFLRILFMVTISMFSLCGLAQISTMVDDANALFKFEIVDKVQWVFSTDIDSDRGESISYAATPNGVEPFTCEGVCISHKCRDTSGVVDSEEFV